VKRGAWLASLLVFGAAGAALAFALAATPVAGADGGTTGSTTTSEPEPPPTTTEPPPPPPQPRLIAAGITVGHTLVGGLSPAEAQEVLRAAFARPITLVVSPTRKITVAPRELGAAAHVASAVKRALAYRRPGFNVPLPVDVPLPRVERYVEKVGLELDRKPVDSRLVLHSLRPFATKAVNGRRLNRVLTEREIVTALRTHVREPIQVPFRVLVPELTPETIGHVIVIRRGSNKLFLYNGMKFMRRFQVATGRSSYPTPIGHFEVVIKQRDPWWYPPAGSAWAEGEKPVPPGPGNPLGTRWMGLSAPYVGIHGTPDAASIGYSASHGCIRMRISEAEWLFDHIDVGTQVFIVPA
jgi:lipoprotein-anchoring transpeptidase ErfK/SrfK